MGCNIIVHIFAVIPGLIQLIKGNPNLSAFILITNLKIFSAQLQCLLGGRRLDSGQRFLKLCFFLPDYSVRYFLKL